MIERFPHTKLLAADPKADQPAALIRERAYRDCGCQVLIGVRLDKGETSTFAYPCDEHDLKVENDELIRSLDDPCDLELVVVWDNILMSRPYNEPPAE